MGKMSELDQEIRDKQESGWNGRHKPEIVGKSDSGEIWTEESENLSSEDYYDLWKKKHGYDEDEEESENSDEEIENEEPELN